MKKQDRIINKKELLRKEKHLTTPPRLKGVVKNAKMNPIKKKKKEKLINDDKKKK